MKGCLTRGVEKDMFVRNKGLYFMLSLLAIIVVLTGCGTTKETQETMDYA